MLCWASKHQTACIPKFRAYAGLDLVTHLLAEEDSFSRKEGISCDIKVSNAVYALKGMMSDILNNTSPPPMYRLIDALNECVSGLSNLLHIMKGDSFCTALKG
jgi:hypothetical protein